MFFIKENNVIIKLGNKMEYIEDLSYSNLVNLIQGEEIKAADALNCIALEMEENNKIIGKIENDLACANYRKASLISASQSILQHLKKESPLAVQRDNYIVVVTDRNISIERNVL